MNLTLILPATVNVNNCYFLQRTDPKDRTHDLLTSVKSWLQNSTFNLVVVENSGLDVRCFDIFYPTYENRLELLIHNDNNYPRQYGKGFGEQRAINYALQYSKLLQNTDYVFKVTGRYFLTELPRVFSTEFKQDLHDVVIYDTNSHRGGSACVFFYAKRNLYDRYMKDATINDSCGKPYEDTLRYMVSQVPNAKILKINKMGISGMVSGTANTPIVWMA